MGVKKIGHGEKRGRSRKGRGGSQRERWWKGDTRNKKVNNAKQNKKQKSGENREH